MSHAELIGVIGTLAEAYRRARYARQSGLCATLLGQRGVGKESFARLIAGSACVGATRVSAREFLRARCDRLSARHWERLLQLIVTGDAQSPRRVAVCFCRIEDAPASRQRDLARTIDRAHSVVQILLCRTCASSEDALRGIAPELAAIFTRFPIALPPLSERLEDLPALATRFLTQESNRWGAPCQPLSAREIERLRALDMPGNLDDLRRIMRAVVRQNAFPEKLDVLLATPSAMNNSRATPNDVAAQTLEPDSSDFLTLDQAARRHIEEALRRCHGVVEGPNGVATLLQIHPHTLRARMRKLGVDWTAFREV